MSARVTETFFALHVGDMQRATSFYVGALGAEVMHATAFWTSLRIAGVRVGLFHDPTFAGAHTGLHFAVDDLAGAIDALGSAGGRVVVAPTEAAPGVVVADVADTEGNVVTLRGP